MSLSRIASIIIGYSLLFDIPLCPYISVVVIILLLYGFLPRKGIRIKSRLIRTIYRVFGSIVLAFSIFFTICLLIVGAPIPVVVLFIAFPLIPSLSLVLYGFEIGLVIVPSNRITSFIRLIVVSLTLLLLSLTIMISYSTIAITNPKFLTEVHEVGVGFRKIALPGWIIMILSYSLGILLLIMGSITLIRFRYIATRIQKLPKPKLLPGYSKIGQIFVLIFSALLISTGIFVYLKTSIILAGLSITVLGIFMTLLITDISTLKAIYEEFKKLTKLKESYSYDISTS